MKPKTVTVGVEATEEDILLGRPGDCHHCPIGLAMARAIPMGPDGIFPSANALVGEFEIAFIFGLGGISSVDTDPAIRRFIRRFDRLFPMKDAARDKARRKFKPFSFKVSLALPPGLEGLRGWGQEN